MLIELIHAGSINRVVVNTDHIVRIERSGERSDRSVVTLVGGMAITVEGTPSGIVEREREIRKYGMEVK